MFHFEFGKISEKKFYCRTRLKLKSEPILTLALNRSRILKHHSSLIKIVCNYCVIIKEANHTKKNNKK